MMYQLRSACHQLWLHVSPVICCPNSVTLHCRCISIAAARVLPVNGNSGDSVLRIFSRTAGPGVTMKRLKSSTTGLTKETIVDPHKENNDLYSSDALMETISKLSNVDLSQEICRTSESHLDSCMTKVTSSLDGVDMRSLIELEMELHRQDGILMPSALREKDWQELENLKSRSARRKFLLYLAKIEMHTRNQRIKQERRQIHRSEVVDRVKREMISDAELGDAAPIRYGLFRNSIFLRIRDGTIDLWNNQRLIQQLVHSPQPLIIDMGYNDHMTPFEQSACANQMHQLFGENRSHDQPFNLCLYNADMNSRIMQCTLKRIPTLLDIDFPVEVFPHSYLDDIPRNKLVYLTPNCNEDLMSVDPDEVYIVGGIVDVSNTAPLSMAKAKREGIKMRKFAFDRHLLWGIGHKRLTLNQVVSILLDARATGDWKYAFRHVPKRKLFTNPDQASRHRLLLRKHFYGSDD